jgi:hypothetical protein
MGLEVKPILVFKANNVALKASRGKFILLINPDTIVSEDTITKMIEFLNEHPIGLAGCKILNPMVHCSLCMQKSFGPMDIIL